MTIFPEQAYTRHRTFGPTDVNCLASVNQVNTVYAGETGDPWKVISTTSFPYDIYSNVEKDMWDVVSENYTSRIANGEIINNPMEQQVNVVNDGQGTINRSWINRSASPPYTYSGFRWTGTYPLFNTGVYSLPATPSISEDVIDEAITAAWAKISANEADMLVQLGEAKETVSSLKSIFTRAYRIFRHVKRLNAKALLREITPKQLADRYMEARYALRPLMYDAKGIMALFEENQKEPRQTFRSKKENVNIDSYENVTLRDLSGESPTGRIYYGNQLASRSLTVRAGVLTALEAIANSNFSRMGFFEVVESGWELVPLSFVVDWFFNVGKFIASWTPNYGFKTLASWYVVTDTTCLTSTVTSAVNTVAANYEDYFDVTGSLSTIYTTKYRCPNPSRPQLPQFTVNMNWWKTLDLGIILKQFAKLASK